MLPCSWDCSRLACIRDCQTRAPRSFTWVLHERGALRLWLGPDDVPDYALYTATWALIAPRLPELYPGARRSLPGRMVDILKPRWTLWRLQRAGRVGVRSMQPQRSWVCAGRGSCAQALARA